MQSKQRSQLLSSTAILPNPRVLPQLDREVAAKFRDLKDAGGHAENL